MKNPKIRAKYYGRVLSELRDLPDEQQELALYHLHIRIKELKQETNKRSNKRDKSTEYRTRAAL